MPIVILSQDGRTTAEVSYISTGTRAEMGMFKMWVNSSGNPYVIGKYHSLNRCTEIIKEIHDIMKKDNPCLKHYEMPER